MTGRYIPGTGSVRTHYHLRGKSPPVSRYYYCLTPRSSQLSDIWALTPRTLRARNLRLVSTEESHSPPPPPLSSRLDKTHTLQYKSKTKACKKKVEVNKITCLVSISKIMRMFGHKRGGTRFLVRTFSWRQTWFRTGYLWCWLSSSIQ